MRQLVLTMVTLFTIMNIGVSMYMEYAILKLQEQCPCLIHSYHWYVVSLYFGVSVLFLTYSLLYIWHLSPGRLFLGIMTAYTATTVIFIVSSFIMTLQKDPKCKCDPGDLGTILFIITVIRTLMVVISLAIVISWIIVIIKRKRYS